MATTLSQQPFAVPESSISRPHEAFFSAEHDETQEWTRCPLCFADDAAVARTAHDRLFGRPGKYHVVGCRRCGMLYTNPRPTFESLGNHYPNEYFCYDAPDSYRGFRGTVLRQAARVILGNRMRGIERAIGRLEPGTRVCDVGCSHGQLLAALKRRRACDVVGVDFNPDMVEYGGKHGVPIFCGTLEEAAFDAGQFDLVTMTEYLEHEPFPFEVLGECRRVTRPGGHLVIEVPQIDGRGARWFKSYWSQLDLPRHLMFFTPDTLGRMLAANGYEMISVEQAPGSIGMSVLHVLGYENMGRMSARDLLATAVATIPLFPFLPFLHEFMFVVARAVEVPALSPVRH
jgi:2-polyprenyl-3-methyl-5-hydroxy-6-metoxy-1,4-benzoquinol methylase